MQGYATMSTPYPAHAYMYAQPPPSGAMYAAPPLPHQISRSQSSRYDPAMLAGPPPGAYIASSNGQPVIPTEPLAPRPRHFNDRTSDPATKPLKSAMKRSNRTETPGSGPGANLRRSRTGPVSENDPYRARPSELKPAASTLKRGRSSDSKRTRANSLSRPRSRSQSRHHTPGHLILSLNGTNRLSLSSVIYQDTVDTIRERVLPMWPDGVIFQTYRDDSNEFIVQFVGSPWIAKDSLGLMAMKLILELFAVLARQGYICTSAIDTGHSLSSPRLVFSATPPDSNAEFAMMIFSSGRRKIKLVNHAHQLCQSLTEVLQETFKRRIHRASWDDDDVYNIEMSRLDFDRISDLMIATILQHTSNMGLKLEGTIPLSRSGFWGFLQGRKELWIFRRLPSLYP